MSKKGVPEGRYIWILGQESGKFLTVQDELQEPGTPVVLWEKMENSPAQMWYEEPVTETLRCKLGNLCLTMNDDNEMVVDEYQEDTENQRWKFNHWSALIKGPEGMVVEVPDHNTDSGSVVCATEASDEENQKWAYEKVPNQYFCIVSEFSGLCMEAESKMMGVKSGAKIITGEKDQKDNQLWFEDKNGILRSKVKGMGLVCNKEQGAAIRLEEYEEENPLMQWQLMPNKSVANRSLTSNVLDIKARKSGVGAKVIVWQWGGANNQQWNVEYFKKKSKKSKKKKQEDDDDDDDEDDED